MDLRAMERDFSSTGRPACANEGLLVGCRRPSRKSLENFGSLPRTRSPTAGRACSDEVEEMATTYPKNSGEKMRVAFRRNGPATEWLSTVKNQERVAPVAAFNESVAGVANGRA